jgi:hypothetical protein
MATSRDAIDQLAVALDTVLGQSGMIGALIELAKDAIRG